MSTYAANTSVSTEQSRMEIERTLARYGATHFMYGSSPEGAVIAFQAFNRRIKFEIALPKRDEARFTTYHRGPVAYLYAEGAAQALPDYYGGVLWRTASVHQMAKDDRELCGTQVAG